MIFEKNSYLLVELSRFSFFFLFCLLLSSFILFLSFRLNSLKKADSDKLSSYECGFEALEDSKNIFDIRFYLTAILFLIFDLESVFFFLWAVSFNYLEPAGFWLILDFGLELIIGYIYALLIGAFNWD